MSNFIYTVQPNKRVIHDPLDLIHSTFANRSAFGNHVLLQDVDLTNTIFMNVTTFGHHILSVGPADINLLSSVFYQYNLIMAEDGISQLTMENLDNLVTEDSLPIFYPIQIVEAPPDGVLLFSIFDNTSTFGDHTISIAPPDINLILSEFLNISTFGNHFLTVVIDDGDDYDAVAAYQPADNVPS